MTAEELEAQRSAPVLGPMQSAVRMHCLGKLEAAFVSVFMAYFHALMHGRRTENPVNASGVQNQRGPNVDAYTQGRRKTNAEHSIDGDFMEVDPPMRITEPIVLDDDEVPVTASTNVVNGDGKPIDSTDSGVVNPISSSIEIVTAPHSSQQSVEHIPNGQGSRLAIEDPYRVAGGVARDPLEIKNDALMYAKEVEDALFDKLKEFSREKLCWQAGAAYK